MGQGVWKLLAGGLTVVCLWPAVTQAAPTPVRLLVELRHPTSLEEIQGVREVRALSDRAPRLYVGAHGVRRAGDLRRWRVIEVDEADREQVQAELERNPVVVSVQEEPVYQAALIPFDSAQGKPNDPYFSEQFGLHSDTWLVDINAPEAWERTTGSTQTVIAIVDAGVDLTHEDLQEKVWVNEDELPGNGVDDDANGFIDDVHGWDFVRHAPVAVAADHATHVAGIAAASGNNGVGVAGVDWGARIMSVRVLGSTGFGGEADIVAGIHYAVANGARIINLSLVGSGSPAMLEAIENAYAAGAVVVAAAGNAGVDTGQTDVFPACADVGGVNMVLGVGALDEEGRPARFSNFGTCVDVSAPGEDILSTRTSNRYGLMRGTSMSAPFVSGTAGLYLSVAPGAAPAQVIGALTGTMTAFEGEDATEWAENFRGRLNAAGAVGQGITSGSEQGIPSSGDTGSGGGGSGDSGGGGSSGGGGGGGEEEQPQPFDSAQGKPKQKVAGVRISAADRNAPDFIQNTLVPLVVERLFYRVWGKNITPRESTYWKARARSDKPTESKLYGAMLWWQARGKTMGKR